MTKQNAQTDSFTSEQILSLFKNYLKDYSADYSEPAVLNSVALSKLNAEICFRVLAEVLSVSTLSQSSEYEVARIMAGVQSVLASSESRTASPEAVYSMLSVSTDLLADTLAFISCLKLRDSKASDFKLLPGDLDHLLLRNQAVFEEFELCDKLSCELLGNMGLNS